MIAERDIYAGLENYALVEKYKGMLFDNRLAEFFHRLQFKQELEWRHPKGYSDVRRAIDGANARMLDAYYDAVSRTIPDALAHGIIGSLAYGVAGLTPDSDIDATALVQDGIDVVDAEKEIDARLKEKGISSNVEVVTPAILAQGDAAKVVRPLGYLTLGTDIYGDPSAGFTHVLNAKRTDLLQPLTWYFQQYHDNDPVARHLDQVDGFFEEYVSHKREMKANKVSLG